MSNQDEADQSVGQITTQLNETSLQAPEEPSGHNVANQPPQQAIEVQGSILVEVRSAGDLGKGVFAVHDIARGTRIISEAPLLVVDPPLGLGMLEEYVAAFCAEVEALSAEDLKTLDDLYYNQSRPINATGQMIREWHEQHGDKQGRKLNTRNLRRVTSRTVTRFSIFGTNAIRMGGYARQIKGLFALHSRINHSCSPNVFKSYNPTIKRLTVHATRDIKAGDQLFADYANGTIHSKTFRQGHLKRTWGFVCQCRACTDPEEGEFRDQIMDLVERLFLYENPEYQRADLEGSDAPPQTVQQAREVYEEMAALLRQPALDLMSISLCKIYRNCAKLSLEVDDVQKAVEYARKELEVEELIIGTETEHLRDDLIGAKHWLEYLEKIDSVGNVPETLRSCEMLLLFE